MDRITVKQIVRDEICLEDIRELFFVSGIKTPADFERKRAAGELQVPNRDSLNALCKVKRGQSFETIFFTDLNDLSESNRNSSPITVLKTTSLKLIILLIAGISGLLTPNPLVAQTSPFVYDFNVLNVALINRQDKWQYMGNMYTSFNVPGYANCNIPSAPLPSDIAATLSSGLYAGGKHFSCGKYRSNHCCVTRKKNNATWNYQLRRGPKL